MSRLSTLKKADPVEMAEVRKRYAGIATTIDDAVTKLSQMVDTGEEGLKGKFVEPLKEDAESIKESLTKAARRYHDVVTECTRYEPELQIAIDKTKTAEGAEADGDKELSTAKAMPEPQKGPDGTISPEEEQKGIDKKNKETAAEEAISGAKARLEAALDALDVAGKRFGDEVNCKKYDDGLTDKIPWKVMAFFKKISEIFGYIALVLAILAFIIPGVGLIAILAVAATAILLIADSVLLAGGDGSVLSVVLDAIGLGFGGLGLLAGKFTKAFEGAAKFWKALGSSGFKFKPGNIFEMVDLSKPIGIGAGGMKPNFFQAGWTWLTGGTGSFKTAWLNGVLSWNGFKGLDFLKNLPGISGVLSGFKGILGTWGAMNQVFALGAGVIIAIMQIVKFQGIEGA